MKSFRDEITEQVLSNAYDSLMAYGFLVPLRSKEDAVKDIQIIKEWQNYVGTNGKYWIKNFLDIKTGYKFRRTGKDQVITMCRTEFYLGGVLKSVWYSSKECTGRWESLESVGRYLLRRDNNFKDKSAIDISI